MVFLSCSNWNSKKMNIRSVCLIVNSFVYKKFSNKSLYILKRNDGALGFLEIQEREYCLYLFKIWMQGVTIGCFVAWIANELLLLRFLCVEGVYNSRGFHYMECFDFFPANTSVFYASKSGKYRCINIKSLPACMANFV